MAAAASQQLLALLLLLTASAVPFAAAASLELQQTQAAPSQTGSNSSFGRRLLQANGGCDTECSLYAVGGPCSRFSCQCVNGNYEVTWSLTVSRK